MPLARNFMQIAWVVAVLAATTLGTPRRSFAVPAIDPSFHQMVFQRGARLDIWGEEKAADKVVVSLAGQSYEAPVKQGLWKATLEIPPDLSGEHFIQLRSSAGIASEQVLVGDVWVCGGQSNMAFTLKQATDGKSILESSKGKPIRLLKIEKPGSTGKTQAKQERWLTTDESVAKHFSAVCLAFGVALDEKTHVPLGLVDVSVGGTSIESWISEEGFKKNPSIDPGLEKFKKRDQSLKKKGENDFPLAMRGPSGLFEAMIRPRAEMAIKGVLWYQGEGNVRDAEKYQALLRTLIGDWRSHWGIQTLPFVILQLPGYGNRTAFSEESSWAYLRDAQLNTIKGIPHTDIAVTVDLGDGTLHPSEKREFGRRAADAAWRLTANKPLPGPLAPIVERFSFGETVQITMSSPDGCIKNRGNFPDAFYITGEDQCWFPAEGFIDANSIILKNPLVPQPIAVRYAWSDRPIPVLYSCSGAPVSPFRSDEWSSGRCVEAGQEARGRGHSTSLPRRDQ